MVGPNGVSAGCAEGAEPGPARAAPPDFLSRVERLSGEVVRGCIQCGTCSGSCPSSSKMAHTPRRLMEMIRAGMEAEVLASGCFWYCASCYSCAVRCPREICLPEVMCALKRMSPARRRQVSGRFYHIFAWVVRGWGKMQEVVLMAVFLLTANPAALPGYAPLGLRLLAHHKLNLLPLPSRSAREVRLIWRKAQELEGAP